MLKTPHPCRSNNPLRVFVPRNLGKTQLLSAVSVKLGQVHASFCLFDVLAVSEDNNISQHFVKVFFSVPLLIKLWHDIDTPAVLKRLLGGRDEEEMEEEKRKTSFPLLSLSFSLSVFV